VGAEAGAEAGVAVPGTGRGGAGVALVGAGRGSSQAKDTTRSASALTAAGKWPPWAGPNTASVDCPATPASLPPSHPPTCNAAHAVVSAVPSLGPQPHCSCGQVQVVINHQDALSRHLQLTSRRAGGRAGGRAGRQAELGASTHKRWESKQPESAVGSQRTHRKGLIRPGPWSMQ
jgi:hypothetical protein